MMPASRQAAESQTKSTQGYVKEFLIFSLRSWGARRMPNVLQALQMPSSGRRSICSLNKSNPARSRQMEECQNAAQLKEK